MVHKTKKVKEWVRKNKNKIELFYLPRFSPELNPDEYLNNDIKTNLMGKTNASNITELAKAVKTHLKKKSKKSRNSFNTHLYNMEHNVLSDILRTNLYCNVAFLFHTIR